MHSDYFVRIRSSYAGDLLIQISIVDQTVGAKVRARLVMSRAPLILS